MKGKMKFTTETQRSTEIHRDLHAIRSSVLSLYLCGEPFVPDMQLKHHLVRSIATHEA
jgi:hypothetical protein